MSSLSACPKCGSIVPGGTDTCPRCGVIYAKASTTPAPHFSIVTTGRGRRDPNPLVLRSVIGVFLVGLTLTTPFFVMADPDGLLGGTLAAVLFTFGSVALSASSCVLTVRLFLSPPRLAAEGPWPVRLVSVVLLLGLAAFSLAVVLFTLNILIFRIH
jgi:hypothetical protein